MNKIETVFEELDFRYSNGEKILERHSMDSGSYELNDGIVTSESLTRDFSINRDVEEIDKFKLLSERVDYLRIGKLKRVKNIFSKVDLIGSTDIERYYVEIIKNNERFTALLTSMNEIDLWLEKIDQYLKLPIYTENFDAKLITFSPNAFGYLLHEGLGHRLEGDDYSSVYNWTNFKETNFDVFDSPGEKHWYGYCPYGDDGTIGKEVKLLCGKTGNSALLKGESGNLRMVSYHFHPIVRQRCLMVKRNFLKEIPGDINFLSIIGVEKGSFCNNRIKLFTNMQTFEMEGDRFRLPRLVIDFKIDEILKFSSYGELEISEPASGCRKGIQGQLPVSFYSTSAWSNLDELQINIGVQ